MLLSNNVTVMIITMTLMSCTIVMGLPKPSGEVTYNKMPPSCEEAEAKQRLGQLNECISNSTAQVQEEVTSKEHSKKEKRDILCGLSWKMLSCFHETAAKCYQDPEDVKKEEKGLFFHAFTMFKNASSTIGEEIFTECSFFLENEQQFIQSLNGGKCGYLEFAKVAEKFDACAEAQRRTRIEAYEVAKTLPIAEFAMKMVSLACRNYKDGQACYSDKDYVRCVGPRVVKTVLDTEKKVLDKIAADMKEYFVTNFSYERYCGGGDSQKGLGQASTQS